MFLEAVFSQVWDGPWYVRGLALNVTESCHFPVQFTSCGGDYVETVSFGASESLLSYHLRCTFSGERERTLILNPLQMTVVS